MPAAEEQLKADAQAAEVRDVHVRVTPLERHARLAYLPAYVLDYVYGELGVWVGGRANGCLSKVLFA